MKRILMAAALALLATTAHASQHAIAHAPQQLSVNGYWSTGIAGTSDKQMCVATTTFTSPNVMGMLMLKLSKEGMYFDIAKSNWRLPEEGAGVPVVVTFDTASRAATGHTVKVGQNTDMITVWVAPDAVVGVLEDFANAKAMVFTFPQGNEPQWRTNMIGSRAAAKTLVGCLARIGVTLPQASSPSATSPVAPSTSPIAPSTSPVAPAKKKDDGSI